MASTAATKIQNLLKHAEAGLKVSDKDYKDDKAFYNQFQEIKGTLSTVTSLLNKISDKQEYNMDVAKKLITSVKKFKQQGRELQGLDCNRSDQIKLISDLESIDTTLNYFNDKAEEFILNSEQKSTKSNHENSTRVR